jgi:hypothetical protein
LKLGLTNDEQEPRSIPVAKIKAALNTARAKGRKNLLSFFKFIFIPRRYYRYRLSGIA